MLQRDHNAYLVTLMMITLPLVQMTSCSISSISISDRIGGSDSEDQGCIFQVRQSAAIRYPQTKNLMS